MTGGWDRYWVGDTQHVVPHGDLCEHVDHETCWCAPKVEQVAAGKMVSHNSADGREDYERIEFTTHATKPRFNDS